MSAKNWLSKLFEQQEQNAASADYMNASPEVKSNVEMETEPGKALVNAGAKDIAEGTGFKNTKDALTGQGEFASAKNATQNMANNGLLGSLDDVEAKEVTISDSDFKPEANVANNLANTQKANNSFIDDYYGDSMSSMWKNLSPEDKKILLLDQLGTSIRNMSKARLPMYSAYGQNYEGQDVGDEKSMLQEGLKESFNKGLERRNERLNNQMEQLTKIANFPADIEMSLRNQWMSGTLSNKQKVDFINKMANVSWRNAFKAYLTQNPTAPLDYAMKVVK